MNNNFFSIFVLAIVLCSCNNKNQNYNQQKNKEMSTENRIIDCINVSNTFIPNVETQKYMYENEYIENVKISYLEDAYYREKFYKYLRDRVFDKEQCQRATTCFL